MAVETVATINEAMWMVEEAPETPSKYIEISSEEV